MRILRSRRRYPDIPTNGQTRQIRSANKGNHKQVDDDRSVDSGEETIDSISNASTNGTLKRRNAGQRGPTGRKRIRIQDQEADAEQLVESVVLSDNESNVDTTENKGKCAYQDAGVGPGKAYRSSLSLECPVCLDDFELIKIGGKRIYSTKCGHLFCYTCIKAAIAENQSCPVCQKRLFRMKKNAHPIFI